MNHPLTNWWDWPVVTFRCPCGALVAAEDAQTHASDHWARGDADD